MDTTDILTVLHPMLAIAIVFPLIGIAVNLAWQPRQRRLQTASEGKSKIPGVVGIEHVKMGRYLTGAVMGSAFLALTYSIGSQWYETISKQAGKSHMFMDVTLRLKLVRPQNHRSIDPSPLV